MDSYLNTKEVSQLLRINEKKVYTLASSGAIPGTMVTGKWLFSEKAINDHLRYLSLSNINNALPSERANDLLLMSGSDDPSLSFLKEFYYSNNNRIIYSSAVGSFAGVELLVNKRCDLGVCHADREFIPDSMVCVKLFERNVGFVSIGGDIKTFKDILLKKIRFINRQKCSGIRKLADQMIAEEGIAAESINGFDDSVFTHMEVAASVNSGRYDAGICVEYAARLFNLPFNPLKTEDFYLVMSKDFYFDRYIQELITILRSDKYRHYINNLPGYSCCESGELI